MEWINFYLCFSVIVGVLYSLAMSDNIAERGQDATLGEMVLLFVIGFIFAPFLMAAFVLVVLDPVFCKTSNYIAFKVRDGKF